MAGEIYHHLKQPLKCCRNFLDRLTSDGESINNIIRSTSITLNCHELDKALVVLDRAEEYYGVMEPSRSKQVSTQKQQTLTLRLSKKAEKAN